MNSLENAQQIYDTISQNTPRLSRPLLFKLAQSALVPFLVFTISMVISAYARQYVDFTFQDDNLSLLTAFSTSLLTLVLTWRAWQWSERRFNGWANMRRMFSVVSSVARLEKALQGDDQVELDAAAQSAWSAYTLLAQALNVPPA